MPVLSTLQRKNTKLVVGLISGTSADGIDAVLTRIRGNGVSTRLEQLAFATVPYPRGLSRFILRNSLPGAGSVDIICDLNIRVAHCFADAVRKIAERGGVRCNDIDLIGSHGQTIHHRPVARRAFGIVTGSTLQIGDPSTIAKLTGIPTVGDFRTGDMAVSGQGAPLVPYVDYLLFRSKRKNRILLNIGGIANLTVLPKGCSVEEVSAFDTGPGNIVVDALMEKLYSRPIDKGGRVALSGEIVPDRLTKMLAHPYFRRRPPKSTGREMFGTSFLDALLRSRRSVAPRDLVATATELTASSVAQQYERFVEPRMVADEVLVSGGGVHNRAIMQSLEHHLHPVRVSRIESLGFSSDAKEACCFAVLANETISENPANIVGATGARKPVILGTICL